MVSYPDRSPATIDFAILAIVDPIWIVTMPSGMEILEAKGIGVFVGLPVDCVWNGGSDLQAGVEIYYRGHLRSWLILRSQNDPLLGPQFQHPVLSIGGPISLCPQ